MSPASAQYGAGHTLTLETMGLEITESIVITDTGVECLADVPRRLFVKA
jgi:ectoine hydrolase